MKTAITTLLIVCAAIITGAIVYLDYQKPSKPPAPVAAVPASQPVDQAPSPDTTAPAPQTQPIVNQTASTTVQAPAPVANPTPSSDTLNPVHKLVMTLLHAKSAAEKQAAFDELRKDGELDAAIADLKQQAAQNPNDPEIPTTIGEAELNRLRSLAENGGLTANHDQIGILAMQADQEFDSALQIDPKNWEAQYVKAASMYYWPSNPQTDNQVVQSLTSLIDQQETMPANPAFAQTYVTLGNEYQKLGQPDKAMATWQLGAQEFPSDSSLQAKLANTSAQ
jgi:hypothetical protein